MRARSFMSSHEPASRAPGLVMLILFTLLVPACGPARTPSGDPQATAGTAPDANGGLVGLGDSLSMAEEPTYSGLELLFPEIVQLETWYREALQAVWNDDLETAEARIGSLESALVDVDDENPLASVYFQSLETRLQRLKDLMLEERTLERYLSKVDSLSIISPDGAVDSTALSNLFERRVAPPPNSPRYDLELVENPLTQRWVNFFTGDGRHYMELWLTRLPRYEDLIYKVLDEYKVPRDLIYLALIESGLSMQAHSKANAVGPWQFVAGTGKMYGLKIDWWVDERRNIEKATRAAASHLSDLHDSFESWPLALAAYNCGAMRVRRDIERCRTRDFWRLRTLPSQTRNYVPKFMAALYIGKDPERYGFRIPSQDRHEYDLVTVNDATDLRLIAELAGCSLEQIVELNPHLKRWCTPPGERYDVKVPLGLGEACSEKLAQVPESERVTWRRHRVKKGETLTGLAHTYNTSVQAIREANKLKSKSTIRPGVHLVIPVIAVEEPGPRVKKYLADAAKAASSDVASSSTKRLSYKVRRGDTLSSIARKHNVSVKQIMKWNRKRSHRIIVGERIRIYKSVSAD